MNEESFAPETVYLKNVVIINEYAIRRRNDELSPARGTSSTKVISNLQNEFADIPV
jgi:hypothetical protein